MKKELKERVKQCDSIIQTNKVRFNIALDALNKEIKKFGEFREEVIHDVIDRFRHDMQELKKNVNYEYAIPEKITANITHQVEYNGKGISFDKNMEMLKHSTDIFFNGANQLLKSIYNSKGLIYNNPSTNPGSSGVWWADMIVSGFNLLVSYAEKSEKEETAVVKYENEVKIYKEKVETDIKFFEAVDKRIEELIYVTTELKKRCLVYLSKFETILPHFNSEKTEDIDILTKLLQLIGSISEISKVEIFDSENRLSHKDEEYIIECRKLISDEQYERN